MKIPKQIRDRIFAKSGGRCRYCHCLVSRETGTIDHRTPVSRGGGNWDGNLCVACYPCNSAKGEMSEADFIAASPWKQNHD